MATAGSRISSAANGKSASKPTPATVRKLNTALTSTEQKLERTKKAVAAAKANAGKAGAEIVSMGETIVVASASSAISGAVGPKKRKYVRAARGVTAVASAVWGLTRTLKGKSGSHQLAVATGLATAEAVEASFTYASKLGQDKGWYAIEGGSAVSGVPQAHVGVAPEVAVTPGAGGATGVREMLPADPALEAFRQRGRARSAAMAA